MRKIDFVALIIGASCVGSVAALAGPISLNPDLQADAGGPSVIRAESDEAAQPIQVSAPNRGHLGGGFIEFVFGGDQGARSMPRPRYEAYPAAPPPPAQMAPPDEVDQPLLQAPRASRGEPARPGIDPRFEKQVVDYPGTHAPGTIVIDTPNRFLYLVQGGGKAMRYGIGVGRPGFTWAGVKHISQKREWPAWTPPPEMLKRRPDLPRHMEGGPENPLGARAMYLGSSLYRIHGSNEPWTIGTAVSSGCIRMRNEDVMDLYERVRVGTRVVVM